MSIQTADSFKILLAPDKRFRSFQVLGSLLVFLNAFVLFYLAYTNRKDYHILLLVSTAVIPIVILIAGKKVKAIPALFLLWIFFSVTWPFYGHPWIGLVNLLLLAIAWRVMTPSMLIFKKEMISTTILLRNTILWSQLNQVILKDGLITLDFKNNRLIQSMIDETIFTVNQQDFNEFCTQQLKLK